MIEERPRTAEPQDASASPRGDPLVESCPYLLAVDRGWRATTPSAAHRCTAFAPPAPLAADKQRRLCLTSNHTTCATYLAALAARRERGLPTGAESPYGRPLARTTPVVEIRSGIGATLAAVLTERRGWQAIPAIVLVLALVAVGLSSLGRTGGATAALTSPSPSLAATPSVAPTATPAATLTAAPSVAATATPAPSLTPAPTPIVTPAPTPIATPTQPPQSTRSYTVKSGDTLYGIARTFGTTVAAIKELNNLTSNTLHIGQVLKIP